MDVRTPTNDHIFGRGLVGHQARPQFQFNLIFILDPMVLRELEPWQEQIETYSKCF